jgi:hypothetical protein
MVAPRKTPVFISFDYDNDRDLKELLVGQSCHANTPFSIIDHSIRKETKNWKADARKRIARAHLVIVICGQHTHRALGVAREVEIARKEGIKYRLLRGRKDGTARRPQGTSFVFDPIHDWTWDNLRTMTDMRPWWQTIW